MKRKVYSSIDYASVNKEDHTIDITIVFNEFVSELEIAAAIIQHPMSLSINKRWSDEHLTAYSDFITSVESMIGSRFQIIKSYQSKKSYAYYIDFKVPVDDMEEAVVWTVRFRIADHLEKGDRAENLDFNSNLIFKSIVIGDNLELSTPFNVLNQIRRILNGLAVGDFNVLYERYTSRDFKFE